MTKRYYVLTGTLNLVAGRAVGFYPSDIHGLRILPAEPATDPVPAKVDPDGNIVIPAIPSIPGLPARPNPACTVPGPAIEISELAYLSLLGNQTQLVTTVIAALPLL
jgi:hypothetical protein